MNPLARELIQKQEKLVMIIFGLMTLQLIGLPFIFKFVIKAKETTNPESLVGPIIVGVAMIEAAMGIAAAKFPHMQGFLKGLPDFNMQPMLKSQENTDRFASLSETEQNKVRWHYKSITSFIMALALNSGAMIMCCVALLIAGESLFVFAGMAATLVVQFFIFQNLKPASALTTN